MKKKILPLIKENDIVFVGNALYARFNEEWSDQWTTNGEKYFTRNGAPLSIDDASKAFTRKFKEFADAVVSRGGKIILYIDDVQFSGLKSAGLACKSEWYRPQWAFAKECFQDLESHMQVIERHFFWRNAWRNNRTKVVWNAYENGDSCSHKVCNASKYADSNHFTRDYAALHFYAFVQDHPDLFVPDKQ
ncbi:MAG: hypothetical protein NTY67_00185 [Cyanobacteria bacterium]|nr:hypothetical protein [Cyanobacteriota bacterium]